MAYRVLAPCVVASDQSGRIHHRYAGHVIPWLSEETKAHLLGLGMVEEVPGPVAPGIVASDEALAEPEAAPSDPASRPAQTAPKQAWVEHVAAVAGVAPEEAEKLGKPELIALADS